MHKTKTGWGMAALSGNNPFESSGMTATLAVTNGTACSMVQTLTGPTPLPFSITLNDPDLAGINSVNVNLYTSQGDSETITLNAAGGGLFIRNTLVVNKAPPASGNGVLDLLPVSQGQFYACPSVTVIYMDTTTPTGMPQAVQSTVAIP
jgi:hypothetical protein